MFLYRTSIGLLAVAISLPTVAQTKQFDGLLRAGHYKQLQRSLDSSKKDAETFYLLSKVNQAFRKHPEALEFAEAAVKANPNNAKYHLQLASILGDDVDKVGLFKKMSLGNRIHSEIDTAYKLEPKNTDCMWGVMQYYERAPGIVGGSKEKAKQMAEEIGKVDAAKGYLAQAALARNEKQNDQLEDLYLKAVQADPKNYQGLISLATYYMSDSQKKYDLAERYAKQALDLDPTRTASHAISAEVAALKQSWDKLETLLAQAEQANRDDLSPFYQAGRTLLQLNQELTRAERYLRKYLSQDPEGFAPLASAAHWRLGLILEQEGRKDEAVKELEEALRLQPDFENATKDLKRLKG